jgi:hypothetical protein
VDKNVIAKHGDAEYTSLNVLACTSLKNQSTSEPSSSSFWKLLVNMNLCPSSTHLTLNNIPTILDPVAPADLQAQPDDQDMLKKYLNERR